MVMSVFVSVSLVRSTTSDDSEKYSYRLDKNRTFYQHVQNICECEENGQTIEKPVAPKTLSRLTLMLYASKLYPYFYLPVPRLLTPRDPLFSYPELKRGLLRRRDDEERLKKILSSTQVMEARKNQDQPQLQNILKEMNCVIYGEGVTPQIRESFLMQYGCTGFTDEILQYLVQAFGQRGIVEVGSGNGQWARALTLTYHELMQKQSNRDKSNKAPKSWNFVLAYDNMEQLPLSPEIYHKNTLPANEYFFNAVKRASHIDAVQDSGGRVLLLVYPPPGPMAIETVMAYLKDNRNNDTVVYVGEGREGANADDAFFNFFLGYNEKNKHKNDHQCQWVLEKVMNVRTCPGDKGYEKLFVFRHK